MSQRKFFFSWKILAGNTIPNGTSIWYNRVNNIYFFFSFSLNMYPNTTYFVPCYQTCIRIPGGAFIWTGTIIIQWFTKRSLDVAQSRKSKAPSWDRPPYSVVMVSKKTTIPSEFPNRFIYFRFLLCKIFEVWHCLNCANIFLMLNIPLPKEYLENLLCRLLQKCYFLKNKIIFTHHLVLFSLRIVLLLKHKQILQESLRYLPRGFGSNSGLDWHYRRFQYFPSLKYARLIFIVNKTFVEKFSRNSFYSDITLHKHLSIFVSCNKKIIFWLKPRNHYAVSVVFTLSESVAKSVLQQNCFLKHK